MMINPPTRSQYYWLLGAMLCLSFVIQASYGKENEEADKERLYYDGKTKGHPRKFEIILKPSSAEVSPDQEVAIDIFITNLTRKPIEVPASDLENGYSIHVSVNIDTTYYKVAGEKLEFRGLEIGGADGGSHPVHKKLKPGESVKYKIKWQCMPVEFDFCILDVNFYLDGVNQVKTTLISKPQQNAAEQPATRLQSKPK